VFALYALGEVGRVYPQAYEAIKIGPETIIMGFFNSSVEETKTVASYSLGCLATGNLPKYLPILLHQIKAEPKGLNTRSGTRKAGIRSDPQPGGYL